MSRHLSKLQSLFQKLEARYGAQDEAVRQVGDQLKLLEMLKAQREEMPRRPERERVLPGPRLL